MNNSKKFDIIYLTFLYFKKLFNFKNILFFVLSFLSFLSVWFIISDIITSVNPDELAIDAWVIMFFSVWIGSIINYCYVFLKKNNFEMVEEWKNSISNFIILLIVFIILFLGLYFSMFDGNSILIEEGDFIKFLKIFFNYFILIFAELLFISFIYNKRLPNIGYIFIIFITVFNFIYLFYCVYSNNNIFEGDTFIFSHALFLIYINLILLVILSIANFIKRLFIYKFIE